MNDAASSPLSIDTDLGSVEVDGFDELVGDFFWLPRTPHPKSPKQLGELLRALAPQFLAHCSGPKFVPPGEPIAGRMSRVYRTADRVVKLIDPFKLIDRLVEREVRVDEGVLRYADTLLKSLWDGFPTLHRLVGHTIDGLVGVLGVETVIVEEPYPRPAIRLELESIDGLDLTIYLAERKPDTASRRRLFSQLLTILDQLLDSGVYHRDLHRGNLIVDRIESTPRLRLIDVDFSCAADRDSYPSDHFYALQRLTPYFGDSVPATAVRTLIGRWNALTENPPISSQDEFWQSDSARWTRTDAYRKEIADWRVENDL